MIEENALAELRLETRERAEALESLFAAAITMLAKKRAMNVSEFMAALAEVEAIAKSLNGHEGQLACYRSVREALEAAQNAS